MALQVRLRHALGERILELPERGVAEPLVIGRANDADVQIPSVSVSPRHCVLFVREGQWVVQGTAGVSKLNGRPLSGPTALSIGDRISLGDEASPPTLEIDPLGAVEGRSGQAKTGAYELASPATPVAEMPRSSPAPRTETRRPPPPIYLAPPAPAPGFAEAAGQEGMATDQVDWTTAGASGGSPANRYYIRKRPPSSGAGAVFLVILGAAVLGGAAFYAYRRTHRPAAGPLSLPALPATQPAIVEDDTPALHSKLFQPENASSKPAHPAKADATWEDVQARHYEMERQGPAIIAFDEYRRLHPGQFDQELDRYTEDAVNWIWWQRVDQLWRQRDRLAEAIRKKKQDVRAQPAGSFHDRLVQEQAELQAQYAKVQDALTGEMGYENDTPPDVKNPAALKELSKSRDPGKYEVFKNRVLTYVRNHHGDLPWAREG